MARKKKRRSRKEEEELIDEEDEDGSGLLKKGTVHTIFGILAAVVAVFLFFAATNNAGLIGGATYKFLNLLFGIGYYLLPIVFIFVAISFLRTSKPRIVRTTIIGGLLFLLSGLGIVGMLFSDGAGGIVGGGIGSAIEKLFGETFGVVVAGALLIISGLIIFDTKITIDHLIEKWKNRGVKEDEEYDEDIEALGVEDEEEYEEGEEEPEEEEDEEELEEEKPGLFEKVFSGVKNKKSGGIRNYHGTLDYTPPPLSILSKDSGKPSAGDIKANANLIKRTLTNFGIEVEMDEISIGPSITRYAMKPAEGVKLSKIVGLQRELSLALAAHPLRIEAPIPGKALVGIEIPNKTKTTVHLGSLFSNDEFQNSDKPLLVSLGKGISGQSYFANLAKMPHALIAGTTGSGKSVTIHAVISSLLYRNSPENLRFILIDPKRVELTLYNKIPHLLTPVITNPKKAILSLKWAAKEMDRRYDLLEEYRVRDIGSYHENILAPAMRKFEKKTKGLSEEERAEMAEDLPESMPYIVVVIDELADIMTSYPREMEAAIVRLAQMSRAVGIHLILSTQRPSTEIITGLIKANIPARMALQVPSQIDSRTIIDMPGAEKLLGGGDMLYLSSDSSKPNRIQSGYISENEVKKIVQYLIDEYEDEVPDEINIAEEGSSSGSIMSVSLDDDEDEDELYEDARETVISMGKASTSLLQRKLKVGYARAARLIDMLEERGIVGQADGSKPRQVFAEPPEEDYGDEDLLEKDSDEEYEEEEER